MNNAVLKNTKGLFYIEGSGFVTTDKSKASRLNAESAECTIGCAAKMGISGVTAEEVSNASFAVVYIRKGDKVTATSITKAPANASLNQFDPSPRRFATRAEANTHGKRFDTRRANKTDAVGSGTAGHIGFFVIETTDEVNAAVNPKTGLTNSL